MQKLRLGTVEFAIPSTVMSSAVDAFGMFEMPYLVKNREHMKKIEAAVVWREADSSYGASGASARPKVTSSDGCADAGALTVATIETAAKVREILMGSLVVRK